MTEDHTARRTRTASLATIVGTGGRIVLDLLGIALWVLFLTLLFLSTGWPRWGFYALLLLGVGLYVQFTAPWIRSTDSEPASEESERE